MALKIRLARAGSKKRPYYHIVIADVRAPRDGRFIEQVGAYDPLKKEDNISLDRERVDYWMGVGAQPSDTVRSFFKKTAPSD